jgi:phospho-N-acetylmuramoyl-pentapeptide-transferase
MITSKFLRKIKKVLAGRFKIVGQVTIGLIVGLTLYFNDSVVVREVSPATTASLQVMQPIWKVSKLGVS